MLEQQIPTMICLKKSGRRENGQKLVIVVYYSPSWWPRLGIHTLNTRHNDTILKAFCGAGLSPNADGLEIGEIHLRGHEDVVVGNWRLGDEAFASQEMQAEDAVPRLIEYLDAKKQRKEKTNKKGEQAA